MLGDAIRDVLDPRTRRRVSAPEGRRRSRVAIGRLAMLPAFNRDSRVEDEGRAHNQEGGHCPVAAEEEPDRDLEHQCRRVHRWWQMRGESGFQRLVRRRAAREVVGEEPRRARPVWQ